MMDTLGGRRRGLRNHGIVVVTVAVLMLCLLSRPMLAQQASVVEGRITDSLHHPIADVELTIQSGSDTRSPRTNADGRFRALFPEGAPYVSITARKIGYLPVSWTALPLGFGNVITANNVLTRSPVVMPAVVSTADQRQSTFDPLRVVVGGTEAIVQLRRLMLNDPSDLNEIMASMVGLSLSDSGSSLLGSAPSQNSILIDGMKSDATMLPPDAVGTMRYAATTTDVSRSQNAGAELNVSTKRGTDVFAAITRASATDPRVAWDDPASPLRPYREVMESGGVSGPIRRGSAHFILSWALTDRSAATQSLLDPGRGQLAQYGIAEDSVAALSSALGSLGAPLTPAGRFGPAHTLLASAYLKTDWIASPTNLVTVTFYPTWQRSSGVGSNVKAFPSIAGTQYNDQHRLAITMSDYVAGFVGDLRSTLTFGRSGAAPSLDLPAGVVEMGTVAADGGTGLTAIRFGGGGSASSTSVVRWDTKNEFSRALDAGVHQFRFGQELELRHQRSLHGSNANGTFDYPSLDALAADRPDAYTRTLNLTASDYQAATAGLWVADMWRASSHLSVDGGVRADYSAVLPRPALNLAVDTAFGYRTDRLPSGVEISPRLGFAWGLGKFHGGGPGIAIRAPGTNIIQRQRGVGPPGEPTTSYGSPGAAITLFGSLGAYQSLIAPDLLNGLRTATGLPGSQRMLSCAGSDVPTFDWSPGDGAGPSQCADGSGPSAFALTSPAVRLLEPGFRAPLTWKASVGILFSVLGDWFIHPELAGAISSYRPSTLDLNMGRTPAFYLPAEGGRPVFVTPGEIDPASGTVAPGANRVDNDYGAVSATRSNLHGEAGQFVVDAGTETLFGAFPLELRYALNLQRAQSLGTPRDPFAVEWVTNGQATHRFIAASRGFEIWWFTFGAQVDVSSGIPFTPMVAGDVNGDHQSANDNAFIFSPAAGGDTALAGQMRSLLATAPAAVRRCLAAQEGQIAGTASCRTGWQARLDLKFDFAPAPSLGLTPRLRLTTRLVNAGGALVRLLGLQNTPLGLSPGTTQPDQRLLFVTGFDPATERFSYRVNQLFGRPTDFGVTRLRVPPMQLQVGAEYDFGPLGNRYPLLSRIGLSPRKGVAPAPADVAHALRSTYGANPVTGIVALADSLGLTSSQRTALQVLADGYDAQVDSVFAPVVRYVVEEGSTITDVGFGVQLNSALRDLFSLDFRMRKTAEAVLTPDQRTRLGVLGG